jgi:hypothetical protein
MLYIDRKVKEKKEVQRKPKTEAEKFARLQRRR